MNEKRLQKAMHRCITKLEDYAENYLKNDGDKEEDSQKVCIMNHCQQVRAAINGIEGSDIKLKGVQ